MHSVKPARPWCFVTQQELTKTYMAWPEQSGAHNEAGEALQQLLHCVFPKFPFCDILELGYVQNTLSGRGEH